MLSLLLSLSISVALEPLPPPSGGYTIGVLPDSQTLDSSYPDIFDAQLAWIAGNLAEHQIELVLHVGDV